MTTQGSELINENNHPFYSERLGFALAHNGVLCNDLALKRDKKLPVTNIQTDSYVAVQLIDSKKALNHDTIKYMAETVEGSFCFTILGKNNELYIVKGDNPMAIVEFNGFYIYVSTAEILNRALKRLRLKNGRAIKAEDGEILRFCKSGVINRYSFDMSNRFHYPYFTARRKHEKMKNEYLNELIYYAEMMDIDEETVMEMVDMGYSYMEIEDMLYETENMRYEEDFYAEL